MSRYKKMGDKQESGEKRDKKKKKEPKIYQVPPISERKYIKNEQGFIMLQW